MFEKIIDKLLGELSSEQKKLRDTLIFFLRLIVLAIPLYLIMFFADLYPLQVLVANHSFYLLQSLGFTPVIDGSGMIVNDFSFFISKDSTGWKSLIFLTALIFAVPGINPRKRLFGLIIGLPLIYIGNLGRVIAIVFVEQSYGLEAGMLVHDYLWRFGLIALVLGIWLVWFHYSRGGKKE